MGKKNIYYASLRPWKMSDFLCHLFLLFKGHFVPHWMKLHDFSVFYTQKPMITILLLAQCLVHAGKVTSCWIKVLDPSPSNAPHLDL